ncbi:MAG: hypothetical protein IH944_11090 [Armatimonadetes bacterium]|nr:hypothetical protein [Armatimonadota bacterium]
MVGWGTLRGTLRAQRVTFAVVTVSLFAVVSAGAFADIESSPNVGQQFSQKIRQDQDWLMLQEIANIYVTASKSALLEGDYAVAERAARNGLDVVPSSLRLLRLQGEALIRLGYHAEALRVVMQYNDSQKDKASFARIGLLLARLGQTAESLRRVKAGLLDLNLPESLQRTVPTPRSQRELEVYWLLTIGIVSESYANDDESLYYYGAAQQLRPNDLIANFRLGRIHMRKHEYERAIAYFERVRSAPAKVQAEADQKRKLAIALLAAGG